VYSVIFTRAARGELIEAQGWYEGEATGLGRRFRQAVEALVERMSDNPRQFPTVFKNVRRALLRRFPYSLFFVVEDDALIVDCVFSR
jgi:plasmid stabilization system protein ParE